MKAARVRIKIFTQCLKLVMWDVIFCTFVIYMLYILFGGVLFTVIDNTYEFVQIEKEDNTFEEMRLSLMSSNFSTSEIEEAIGAWSRENSIVFISSPEWTFLNAFLFTFHLCSTVGYGDQVPRSSWGQALSLMFGVLGVPLHLLLLKLAAAGLSQARHATRRQHLPSLLADLLFFSTWTLLLFAPSALLLLLDTSSSSWAPLDPFYFAFITFATVGFGDIVPEGPEWYRLLIVCWSLHGTVFLVMLIDQLARLVSRHCLFALRVDAAGRLGAFRVGIDPERLDLHFRLANYPGLRYDDGDFWGVVGHSEKAEVLHHNHLRNLEHLTHTFRRLLGVEAQRRGDAPQGLVNAFPHIKKRPPPITADD